MLNQQNLSYFLLVVNLFIGCNFAWSPLQVFPSSPCCRSRLLASMRSIDVNQEADIVVVRNDDDSPQRNYQQVNFYEEEDEPGMYGNVYNNNDRGIIQRRRSNREMMRNDDDEYLPDIRDEGSFDRNYDRNFVPASGPPDTYYNERNYFDDDERRYYDRRMMMEEDDRFPMNEFVFDMDPYELDRRRGNVFPNPFGGDYFRPMPRPFANLFHTAELMMEDLNRMATNPFMGNDVPFSPGGMMQQRRMMMEEERILVPLLNDAERYLNDDVACRIELGDDIRIGPVYSQSSSTYSSQMHNNNQTRKVTRVQAWVHGEGRRTGSSSIRLEATERGIEQLILQLQDERDGTYRDVYVRLPGGGSSSRMMREDDEMMRSASRRRRKPIIEDPSTVLDAEFETS